MLRRKLRVLLIPLALVVLVVGTALPASASSTYQGTAATSTAVKVKPNSLNW